LKLKLIASIIITLLLALYPVSSAIIGVSPSIIRFNKMLRQGYAETQVTITTSTEKPIKAHFTKEGEIQDWITLEPEDNNFEFSRTAPYVFTLIIQPPEDAKSGNYSGVLKMTTDELATVETGAGSSLIAQIALLIYIEVIGEEIIQCRAGAISASSAEIGQQFRVRTTVHNDGNVRIRPEIRVDVWDQYQTRVVNSKTFLGDQILPTRSKDIMKEIENDLPIGQYFADIYVKECDVSQITTFDIVEKGGIADSGELIGIRTNKIAFAKEPLPIAPMFHNSGSRKVLAQFKGEIRNLKTNKIAKILESDKLEVDAGETMEFPLFFTPEEQGEYQISGRIIYNNKITYNGASEVVKVIKGSSQSTYGWLFLLIGYFILGLIILIIIGKIRQARRHKKKKF